MSGGYKVGDRVVVVDGGGSRAPQLAVGIELTIKTVESWPVHMMLRSDDVYLTFEETGRHGGLTSRRVRHVEDGDQP